MARALAAALALLFASARAAPPPSKVLAAANERFAVSRKTGATPDFAADLSEEECKDWVHQGPNCFVSSDDWAADPDLGFSDKFLEDFPSAPGTCASCGYGENPTVQLPSDCQTCQKGFDLMVVYEDCTGFCADKELKDYLKSAGLVTLEKSDCKRWPCYIGGEALACPELVEATEDECPQDPDISRSLPRCDEEGLEAGAFCQADGECGTEDDLDNCPGGWTVYRVVKAGEPLPPAPEKPDKGTCPEGGLEAADDKDCPNDAKDQPKCDDEELTPGDTCRSRKGECDTDAELESCDGKAIYVVQKVVEKGCPAEKLVPVDEDDGIECPDDPKNQPRCDDASLRVGDTCRSRKGECGTDDTLETCEGWPVYHLPTEKQCPDGGLAPVEADACPAKPKDEPKCDDPSLKVGDTCRPRNGQCGTDKNLENCGEWPVYVVLALEGPGKDGDKGDYAPTPRPVDAKYAPTPRPQSEKSDYAPTPRPAAEGYAPTPRPSEEGYAPTPRPTDDLGSCPYLEAVTADDCPAELNIRDCETEGLVVGDLCEGDGERGTDKELNNCSNEKDADADIYRCVAAPPGPVWFKKDDPSKDCAWVSGHPPRCAVLGNDGKFAYEVCPSCGGSVAPTPRPGDTAEPTYRPSEQAFVPIWYKTGDRSKDCDWVAEFPKRCSVMGNDGRVAYEACESCGGSVAPTPEGFTPEPTYQPTNPKPTAPGWFKAGEPDKTCAWVAQFLKRCSVKGDDGTLAADACDVCGGSVPPTPVGATPEPTYVPTYKPTKSNWRKKDDFEKDCDWVAQFPPRCGVVGEDGRLAYEACDACGGSLAPTPKDYTPEPSYRPTYKPTTTWFSWRKKGDFEKDCAWVAEFDKRCSVMGQDGRAAFEVCPSCGGSVAPTPEGATPEPSALPTNPEPTPRGAPVRPSTRLPTRLPTRMPTRLPTRPVSDDGRTPAPTTEEEANTSPRGGSKKKKSDSEDEDSIIAAVVIIVLLLIICCVCYMVAGRGGRRDERAEFTADVDAWDERGYRDEVELTSNYNNDYDKGYGEPDVNYNPAHEDRGFA